MDVAVISAIASVASAIVLVLVLLKLNGLAGKSGAGISVKELGAELAGPIEAAFKAHVPNPEKFAAANAAALEQASKKAAESVEALHKNLLSAQQQMFEKWVAAEKVAVQQVEQVAKAFEQAVATLQEAQHQATAKWSEFLAQHVQSLERAEAASREQLKAILSQHADSLGKASAAIASQLDKIMQLEKDIQQLLHIQQVVDGSIKAVSSAEEFKATLIALRKHLEEADSLIREATKPRTIRLIEQEA